MAYPLNIKCKKPEGIAQAINLGINFVKKRDFYLMLGDNIFLEMTYLIKLEKCLLQKKLLSNFKKTNNPELFGIVEYYNNKIKKLQRNLRNSSLTMQF